MENMTEEELVQCEFNNQFRLLAKKRLKNSTEVQGDSPGTHMD